MTNTQANISAIIAARHHQSHTFLGLHSDNDSGYLVINTFQPEAQAVTIIDKISQKELAQLSNISLQSETEDKEKVLSSGFFSKKLRRKKHFDYQLKITKNGQSEIIEDPFAFDASLSDFDAHLLSQGNHDKPYQVLGAHLRTLSKKSAAKNSLQVSGVSFTLWAPNASHVAVIGDFNHWDGRRHPMKTASGYWSIFIPNVCENNCYKFELKDAQGHIQPLKADPYAIQSQYRPETASVVSQQPNHQWQDKHWIETRALRNARDAAISIYEVHLGSWRRDENNEFLNYRDIADLLIPYVLDMGFTHIQLMPISEFPFDGSWGYQPVGLFAPSVRFGSAEDFQYFVDQCHLANIGLLIDWVPGHFPSDDHGLAQFDGSHLFEHADPRQGFHPDWNTLIYNYGRVEVANFLRASALHWLDNYHVDGIRVDAVASMLYLDYSRKEGEWIPNKHGGRENLEAVDFLKRFNEELYSQYPGTFSVAEESTSWPGVSKPTDSGGLGFGYKWNMGWMNDSLTYMKRDPVHRKHHHNEMSFGLVYAFDENFILPLSHDEVVHGKGSIIDRMPGDAWQQFANLRAYYGFMWAHPGKKLLFMGCEFAQGKEWDHDSQLDWHQLETHWHAGVQLLVKDLNRVYKNTAALYELDCQSNGFAWLDHDNHEQSVYSFIRFDKKRQQPIIVVCNFNDQTHHDFNLGVPKAGEYQVLLNSDNKCYGGSGQACYDSNKGTLSSQPNLWQGQAQSITISVPPLSTVILAFKAKG